MFILQRLFIFIKMESLIAIVKIIGRNEKQVGITNQVTRDYLHFTHQANEDISKDFFSTGVNHNILLRFIFPKQTQFKRNNADIGLDWCS